MNLARTAWAKTQAIARVEATSYLRSRALGVSLLLVLAFTLWSSRLGATRTLEIFLGSSEALAVLLSAFVLTLIITAGIAREEREAFGDVWNSLPVRNAQQFWGKVLGASGAALLFAIGLLALLPIGWLAVGTVWTEATTSMAWAYVAQTAGVLIFAIGIASFLRGVIVNLRLRYVLGLLIVVALSIAQALGIDNQALWAVLLSPYMLGSLPYDQSLLFGMWPWGPVVAWHVIFQVAFSATLLLLGRVMYERRRDPKQRALGAKLAIGILALCAIASGTMYMGYWSAVRSTVAEQHYYDVQPSLVAQPHVRAHGYDVSVQMAADGRMAITAEFALSGDASQQVWPLTLHHQWRVQAVRGDGIQGWSREGNFIWLEIAPGSPTVRAVVEYEGRPLLWDWQIGTISPVHFMGEQGGYLSPLLAWYPLPGQRRLTTTVTDIRPARRWLWPVTEPLLPEPVPMRLQWEGPGHLAAVSSLDTVAYTEADGRVQQIFQGQSEGIAVLVGPMSRLDGPGFTLIGAASLVHGAELLQEPYDSMVTFCEELIGRALSREPLVAIPRWLTRFYNPWSFRLMVSEGSVGTMRTFTHMGPKPTVNEHALAGAIRAAERWHRTQQPHELLQATSALSQAMLQSIWGRPYTFRAITEEAVPFALAQYTLLRWREHVSGPEAFVGVRQGIREGTVLQHANERERVARQVLIRIFDIEERHGDGAVRMLLGSLYDYMATQPITLEVFEQLVADVTATDTSGAEGGTEQ